MMIAGAGMAAAVVTPAPPWATDLLRRAASSWSALAPVEPLLGRASVVDGDTIEIHSQRVRFNGIDAPESDQRCHNAKGKAYRCGAAAANALDEFLAGSRPTRCEFVGWDDYGRFVGDCYRADGQSVASHLVRQGHALDWPRYSNGRYAGEQQQAQVEHIGVWQGSFTEPWVWRAEQRALQTPAAAPLINAVPNCDIKGNIANDGERIYHLPGQKFYDKTVISRAKGERWFCSEAEAVEAGWRRAKR
jgi:endonuclease YncB( thermonuclease family)